MTRLSTPRLRLRPPSPGDAAGALLLLQDPETALWFGAPDVISLDTAREWCARGADVGDGTHVTWNGVDPESTTLIVNISLFAIDREHSTAKIAYRVSPTWRNQGYASEAVAAVAAFSFEDLGLRRLQLEHSVPNLASCRVAAKAGFRLEGTLRSAFVTADGLRRDVHVHGRLSSDSLVDKQLSQD